MTEPTRRPFLHFSKQSDNAFNQIHKCQYINNVPTPRRWHVWFALSIDNNWTFIDLFIDDKVIELTICKYKTHFIASTWWHYWFSRLTVKSQSVAAKHCGSRPSSLNDKTYTPTVLARILCGNIVSLSCSSYSIRLRAESHILTIKNNYRSEERLR